MAKYWDRNATGTGSGDSWLNAYSNPATLMSTNLSGSGTQEHFFAKGDNPWPFTQNKTEAQASGALTIRGVDPGNGSTRLPRFTAAEDIPPVSGWAEINPATAFGDSGTKNLLPGSKLWHNTDAQANWTGAFRDANGKVFYGRRVKMKTSDNAGSLSPSSPEADYQYGNPVFGGRCIYLTAGNPQTNATLVRRPVAITDSKVWTIDRPNGGLLLQELRFEENDFPINVISSSGVIENVNILDNEFVRCRKGFAGIGVGSQYNGSNRTGIGFRGLKFLRNKGFMLGQQLFHVYGTALMDDSVIAYNRLRECCWNEGSGGIYMDSSYVSDLTRRCRIQENWIHGARFDGKYWDDGSGGYNEYGSHGNWWIRNLFTECEVAMHMNIGTGTHAMIGNVCRNGVGPSTHGAVIIVTADLATGMVSFGDAYIRNNIFDRYGMMIAIIQFNFTGTATDRTRMYVTNNIARGRKSLDGGTLYAIQGNTGIFNDVRMQVQGNVIDDFHATGSATGRDNYGSGATLSDATADSSRASTAAIMAKIPTIDTADRLDIDYQLKMPNAIGTKPAMFADSPAMAPMETF